MAKVLILDDDEFLLEGLSLSLRKGDFELYTPTSVSEALACMESENIDVVLSDVCMPGRSGIEFLKECFLRWPDSPRLIFSGYITADVTLSAINDIKIYKVISKPCLPSVIMSNINDALIERQLTLGRNDLINIAIEKIQCEMSDTNDSNMLNPETDLGCMSRENSEKLSDREMDVIRKLQLGYRVSSISEVLFISPHTVRNHLKSIFQKLNVHSQKELIELVSPHSKNQ